MDQPRGPQTSRGCVASRGTIGRLGRQFGMRSAGRADDVGTRHRGDSLGRVQERRAERGRRENGGQRVSNLLEVGVREMIDPRWTCFALLHDWSFGAYKFGII